jgi:hypothetical protein
VHLISSSPELPVPASLSGGSCRSWPHHAAHAGAAALPGRAEVANRPQAGHAGTAASLEGPSQTAQCHMASTSAPARQQAVARDVPPPSASRALQSMSTLGLQQQLRQRYVARKASTCGAAGAGHTPKKSLAQVLLIRLGIAVRHGVHCILNPLFYQKLPCLF